MEMEVMDRNELFRKIPGIDILLKEFKEECRIYGTGRVQDVIKESCAAIRRLIQNGETEKAEESLNSLKEDIQVRCRSLKEKPVKRVINATGILLHTNLGRAPLGDRQRMAVLEGTAGYSNLEFDLEDGKRGSRNRHFREVLLKVTGAENGIAVNNNAAALLLILTSLTKGKEVLVSRGELVEIGGHFRIPDIMEQSGGILREVGTTNKTRLSDYEKAIGENTGAILKVHTSNYRIMGFTEETDTHELSELGRKYGIPVLVDLGSGALVDFEKYGLCHEPCVQEVLKAGADVVCFSGDKLLGGPQAGVIVGKQEYIKKMEEHPLMRALRLDKMAISALSATLESYMDEEMASSQIPLIAMLKRSREELKEQAQMICDFWKRKHLPGKCEILKATEKVGGGSIPLEEIAGYAVVVSFEGEMSCEEFKRKLRLLKVPVIAYGKDEKIWIDMRTVSGEEARLLTEEIEDLFSGGCL